MINQLYEMIGGVGVFVLAILIPLGGLYWIWMAIQLGSFVMFILGVLGPAVIITAPIGAYSLIFGMPDWIRAVFG